MPPVFRSGQKVTGVHTRFRIVGFSLKTISHECKRVRIYFFKFLDIMQLMKSFKMFRTSKTTTGG